MLIKAKTAFQVKGLTKEPIEIEDGEFAEIPNGLALKAIQQGAADEATLEEARKADPSWAKGQKAAAIEAEAAAEAEADANKESRIVITSKAAKKAAAENVAAKAVEIPAVKSAAKIPAPKGKE